MQLSDTPQGSMAHISVEQKIVDRAIKWAFQRARQLGIPSDEAASEALSLERYIRELTTERFPERELWTRHPRYKTLFKISDQQYAALRAVRDGYHRIDRRDAIYLASADLIFMATDQWRLTQAGRDLLDQYFDVSIPV